MITQDQRQKIDTALSIFMVLGICVILFLVFRKTNGSSEVDLYKYQVQQLDAKILERDKTIEILRAAKARSDSAFYKLSAEISHLDGQLDGIRNSKISIIHDYERVPIVINNFDREQLRSHFTDPKD